MRSQIDGLDARGHDVTLIASKVDSNALQLPRRVNCHAIQFATEGEPAVAAAAHAAVSAAEHFRPDVVHVHSVFDAGVIDALRARWPLVWQAHDHRAHCPNGDRVYPRSRQTCGAPIGAACAYNSVAQGCVAGPRPRTLSAIVLRRRVWRALEAADVIVAASDAVVELLARNGARRERIAKVPLFTAYADRASPLAASPQPRILFVGRLVPQKGVDDVIRLAELARERVWLARLAVVGDGPEAGRLRRAAEQTGTMDMLGRLGAEALSHEYAASSVVVMPSRWAEPFGLVGIEAMAHGRPVVAYDVGGIREWLKDGENGIAVKAWDFNALATAVERLTTATTFAQSLGEGGRQSVRARFRPRHGLEAIERVYGAALSARGATLPAEDVGVRDFRAFEDPASWQDALSVRLQVFVREQDVPEEEEVDGHDLKDRSCVHVLARSAGGRPIGAGRIYARSATEGQLGRMAVLPAYRGRGVGAQIVSELLKIACERGYRDVVLEAQTHAAPFYARWQFAPEGPEYMDCGIAHQRMRLTTVKH